MNRGTRRMWARRMLRAGWLIAPVFSMPRKAYDYFLCDRHGNFEFFRLFWGSVLMGMLGGVTSCSHTEWRKIQVATAAEVTEALRGNACMTDLMPRRAKDPGKEGLPLTLGDLDLGQKDCDSAHKKWQAIAEQERAIAALRGSK